jgi:2-C-methyl-D-erythritol 4-phosphate cytidylyltransferase/2-C-methyl-D-erythritol 2,4-cyclodiphosphate synthase
MDDNAVTAGTVTSGPMRIGIVIVAAGRGERAGSPGDGPKQYRPIGGRPVISHTLETFLRWPSSGPIVVVIHPEDEELFADAVRGLDGAAAVTTTFGGDTRQRSVYEGLWALSRTEATHVMIHDAARPFVDHALLDRIAAGFRDGLEGILPALPVTDTLKRGGANGLVHETVPRAGLYAAQTPQSFLLSAIRVAHEEAAALRRYDFTDDASIAEWAGLAVHLVEGSVDNIKLTVQRDIAMADEKISRRGASQLPDVRTGNGYDVHQLVPGDGVTLCGVFIPHDQKLSGHSDADVALHALTDALLATCGAGDIGDHFPPSDMQWKGAPSRIFLEHAAKIVREKGGTIMNADVSLIAEAPKVGPHRDKMRENLSAMLGISLARCSVKATTNEKIGFVGRREGIAAIATATVVYSGDAP